MFSAFIWGNLCIKQSVSVTLNYRTPHSVHMLASDHHDQCPDFPKVVLRNNLFAHMIRSCLLRCLFYCSYFRVKWKFAIWAPFHNRCSKSRKSRISLKLHLGGYPTPWVQRSYTFFIITFNSGKGKCGWYKRCGSVVTWTNLTHIQGKMLILHNGYDFHTHEVT